MYNAVERTGSTAQITASPEDIRRADALILPGVGAFSEAMRRLSASGIDSALNEAVIDRKAPFLGICLGMQLVVEWSDEGGRHTGLGWIKGNCTRIPENTNRRVPHVGWNEVKDNFSTLLRRIPDNSHFFFDHSYVVNLDDEVVSAHTVYDGIKIPCILTKDNIAAVQFHPEKSQMYGFSLIKNFVESARAYSTSFARMYPENA